MIIALFLGQAIPGVSKLSIFDGMNGNGPLFPVDAALDDGGARRKGKHRFLMGVPLGAMYPPGLFPVDGYDEADEDPNP